ncbi:unnamed protein product [Adineta steineri]|uniref:Secreted protein n=1 Tax=Adineta steineri TaxID=433720 RepID=A0A814C1M0_9BILA|nr:unnamed protein product [Adineta steineri]
MMYTSILLIFIAFTKIVQANEIQLNSQFNSLSLPKELISNTILAAHLQSILMIMASERDFSLNSLTNSTLNYIQHPQSYRMTLLQVSSNMHKLFSSTYSTMFRIQLAAERIPNYIKTILKLITTGSSVMVSRMLPISFNNIARISNENEIVINKDIDQFTNLLYLLNEIQQLPINLTSEINDRTDLILSNKFDLKNAFEKMEIMIQQIKKQFEQIAQLIINLDIKTKFNLTPDNEFSCLIPILYTLENNAYFLYQTSKIYTDLLSRYVLDKTAGVSKYIILSTDEERFAIRSNLSQQLTDTMQNVQQVFIERQNEFDSNCVMLQQAYEKLLDKNQHQNC